MAIVDAVKWEMQPGILVEKFPSEDLRMGTQLVVHPGQTAIFVKGGAVCDEFESGTHTISTNNIPILNKLINIPFGGDSPFQAEVWFVNKLSILDSKWGTTTPLQIEDPKYEIIVPVRAFGQYGFKIDEPRKIIETLVGNKSAFYSGNLAAYFRGKILSQMANIISDKLTHDGISILNINSHVTDISLFAQQRLTEYFAKYGVSLEVFDIISINVNEYDPSFIKLKEAKDLAARIKITGRDLYQMDRSFNVLEGAAHNQGIAGGFMGAGLGMGAGLATGGQMASIASHMNVNPVPTVTPAASHINVNPTQVESPAIAPPPVPNMRAQYFVVVNGAQQGPFDLNTVISSIRGGSISKEQLVWKPGMANWAKIETLNEFSSFFLTPPPVPTPEES